MSLSIKLLSAAIVLPCLLSTTGCSLDGDNHPFAQKQTNENVCDLSLDSLDGTTWVMAEAMPDKTIRDNWQARMKWFSEDGTQKVKYTVKSVADVYTYECKSIRDGQELFCGEIPKVKDWCQALEAHEEGSCTEAKLKKIGADGVAPEKMATAIKEAQEIVAKHRGKDTWKQFQLNNNNLGNKLRGYLYAKVSPKRCLLSVTDMYMTIYNGKKREDSNPVGTNDFVKSDGQFLWDHCDDGRKLLDTDSAERHKKGKVPARKPHEVNKAVYYHYYGGKGIKAEDGCTYSADTYAQWKPVAKGLAPEVTKRGEVIWTFNHTWKDDDDLAIINAANPIAAYAAVRYKECGGKKEKIDTVCNVGRILK